MNVPNVLMVTQDRMYVEGIRTYIPEHLLVEKNVSKIKFVSHRRFISPEAWFRTGGEIVLKVPLPVTTVDFVLDSRK